jgi:hypothetical protein
MISIPAPRQSWIDSFIELIDKPKLYTKKFKSWQIAQPALEI